MKLKKEQIQRLSDKIWSALKEKKLVVVRAPELKITAKIVEVIHADIQGERNLEEEAKDLLEQYRPKINSGELDERRVLQMIKKQLAKDKKVVL